MKLHLTVKGTPYPMNQRVVSFPSWSKGQTERPIPVGNWPDALKDWLSECSEAGRIAMHKAGISRRIGGLVKVSADFHWPRPKNQYTSSGQIHQDFVEAIPMQRYKATVYLLTAVVAGLCEQVIFDMEQVVMFGEVRKVYAVAGHAEIHLETITARDVDPRIAALPEQLGLDL